MERRFCVCCFMQFVEPSSWIIGDAWNLSRTESREWRINLGG